MKRTAQFDVAVIGGGPAGSAAAIAASRAGARVLLLERGRYPRHKVCGEFVSPEGVALLKRLLPGFEDSLLRNAPRITHARVFLDGSRLEAPLEPAAASLPRFDLDAALWNAAALAGADCRQQVTVEHISGCGPFDVESSAGTWESKSILNASGRWSNLHAAAPLDSRDGRWLGLKAHFREQAPSCSVDLYFFDGGYCGVQPVGQDRVNACAMVRADAASRLEEVLVLHSDLHARSRGLERASEPVATSPLVFRRPEPVRDGILFVGDAAGFIDPFVGDGISLALRSGAMAARALQPFWTGETSLAQASAAYARRFRQELRPLFRNASWLRRLTLLPRPLRRTLAAVLGTSMLARFLVRRTRGSVSAPP